MKSQLWSENSVEMTLDFKDLMVLFKDRAVWNFTYDL